MTAPSSHTRRPAQRDPGLRGAAAGAPGEDPGGGGAPPHAAPGEFQGQRFLLALSVILIAITAILVWNYLAAVAFALIFGFLLHPVYRWLKRRVRYGEAAAGLVLVLVAVVIVAPLTIIGYGLVQEARALAEELEDPEGLEQRVVDTLAGYGVPQGQAEVIIASVVEGAVALLQDVVVPAVTLAVEFVIALVVFFILLFFILRDGEQLVAYVRRTLPLDATRRDRLIERTGDRVKGIIMGTFVVGLIQGFAAALGWWVLGLPAPLLWGAILTVFAVLPVLGPFMIMIPAGIVSIIQGNILAGVGIIAWALLLIGVIDDVLRPVVIGKRTRVHPAIILVGLVGGIYAIGITGIVLGPLFLSLLGPVFEAWSRPEEQDFRPPDEDEGGGTT